MTQPAEPVPPLPARLQRIADAEYPRYSPGEMAHRRAAVEAALAAAECDHLVFCGANRAGSVVPWLTQWPVTVEAVGVLSPGEPEELFVQGDNTASDEAKIAREGGVAG